MDEEVMARYEEKLRVAQAEKALLQAQLEACQGDLKSLQLRCSKLDPKSVSYEGSRVVGADRANGLDSTAIIYYGVPMSLWKPFELLGYEHRGIMFDRVANRACQNGYLILSDGLSVTMGTVNRGEVNIHYSARYMCHKWFVFVPSLEEAKRIECDLVKMGVIDNGLLMPVEKPVATKLATHAADAGPVTGGWMMSCESRVDYVDGVSDHTPRAAIRHAQQRLRKLIRTQGMRGTRTLCTKVSRFYDFWGAVIWVRYEEVTK